MSIVNENSLNENRELVPISVKERLPVIDILRGVAILGILLLNIQEYAFPHGFDRIYLETFPGIAGKAVYWGIHFLFQGRFSTMLTILLGLGMAVQVTRAREKGRSFSMVYARRMFFLLLIGVFHDLFLWSGIILPIFAVTGFVLLFFQERKPKTLILWLIIFSLIPLVFVGVRVLTRPAPAPAPEQAVVSAEDAQKQKEEKREKAGEAKRRKCDEIMTIYGEGSYPGMVRHRVTIFTKQTISIIYVWGWFTVGVFLLGIWVWRKGILQDIEGHLRFLKRTLWFSLAVGLTGMSIFYLLTFVLTPSRALYRIIGGIVVRHVGTVFFTLFLMTAIVLLTRKEKWKRILMPVAAVGRMAFSNYVFQTLLCTIFFYSYGFGMFGKTGPVANLFIVFVVWGIQIPLSVWWSKRFRFGPVEWLWRSLTYGKRQPMKIFSHGLTRIDTDKK